MSDAKATIYAAAMELISKKIYPSQNKIAEMTKCSYTTIVKYMREFKKDNQALIDSIKQGNRPMPPHIKELAESFYNAVVNDAENAECDERLAESERVIAYWRSKAEEFKSELDQAKGEINGLKAANTALLAQFQGQNTAKK